MLKSILKNRLRCFVEDTKGYVTIEALIVLPALFWVFGAGWVFYDAFRQQTINQKGNYVIADMISRETEPLDDTYINNAMYLFYTLTKSYGTGSDLRITTVRYDAKNEAWKVVWSEARGDYPQLANNAMKHYQDRLPIAAHNDQLIIVETWDDYDPVFNVGLGDFEIATYSFTPPRYVPRINYYNSDGNNGWGNGDQDATGQSLCNNYAENFSPDCYDNNGHTGDNNGPNGGGGTTGDSSSADSTTFSETGI